MIAVDRVALQRPKDLQPVLQSSGCGCVNLLLLNWTAYLRHRSQQTRYGHIMNLELFPIQHLQQKWGWVFLHQKGRLNVAQVHCPKQLSTHTTNQHGERVIIQANKKPIIHKSQPNHVTIFHQTFVTFLFSIVGPSTSSVSIQHVSGSTFDMLNIWLQTLQFDHGLLVNAYQLISYRHHPAFIHKLRGQRWVSQMTLNRFLWFFQRKERLWLAELEPVHF